MEPWDEEQFKDAVKEALHEWLEEKYAQFGKWTLHGLLASGVVGLCLFIFWTSGLKP